MSGGYRCGLLVLVGIALSIGMAGRGDDPTSGAAAKVAVSDADDLTNLQLEGLVAKNHGDYDATLSALGLSNHDHFLVNPPPPGLGTKRKSKLVQIFLKRKILLVAYNGDGKILLAWLILKGDYNPVGRNGRAVFVDFFDCELPKAIEKVDIVYRAVETVPADGKPRIDGQKWEVYSAFQASKDNLAEIVAALNLERMPDVERSVAPLLEFADADWWNPPSAPVDHAFRRTSDDGQTLLCWWHDGWCYLYKQGVGGKL